jgi:hypothetical protein
MIFRPHAQAGRFDFRRTSPKKETMADFPGPGSAGNVLAAIYRP